MTNNAKIAAYFNIPYCEMELTKCVGCGAYESGLVDATLEFIDRTKGIL